MEVYLLCIAIEGADDRVAWSVLIVEPEGFVEEKSGLASSAERAMFWALKEGFWNVPSRAHVVIRSVHTPLIRFGTHDLSRMTPEESKQEEDADLLDPIVSRIKHQTIVWINPPYQKAGDNRAKKIAQEIVQDPLSCYPPEEIDHISSTYESEAHTLEMEEVHSKEEISHPQPSEKIVISTVPETSFPPSAVLKNKNEIVEKNQIQITPKKQKQSSNIDSIIQSVEEQQKPKEALSTNDSPNPTEEESKKQHTSESQDEPDTEDIESHQRPQKIFIKSRPAPPPPAKRPQLHIEPGPDYLFGPRILAYVDGIGTGNLGAWSFVLVDRKSGSALARASGLRASTPYRARLLACIEVLSALKAENQEIEIRSRWQKLIKLGDQWIHKWHGKNWTKSGNEPIQEVGFIQQLYSICSHHRMSWLYIPDHNDEYGIQLAKRLAKNALNDINTGHKKMYSERIRPFPTDKLL
jgi:ribonuclease HI